MFCARADALSLNGNDLWLASEVLIWLANTHLKGSKNGSDSLPKIAQRSGTQRAKACLIVTNLNVLVYYILVCHSRKVTLRMGRIRCPKAKGF